MKDQRFIQVIDNQINKTKKVLYTGKTHVTGGREGFASSDDGRLQTRLSSPDSATEGTNPEQLFAAGWSACFIGAMRHNAPRLGLNVPEETAVDAELDLSTTDSGFLLQARLQVILPGLSPEDARRLVEAAHKSCPYSKATEGNINVEVSVAI